MQGEHSKQSNFFDMIYDELIPADHLLRKLTAAVYLSFVSDLVSDCCCPDNGRPSGDPLVLFLANCGCGYRQTLGQLGPTIATSIPGRT